MKRIWRRFRPRTIVATETSDDDVVSRARKLIDNAVAGVPRRLWRRHDASIYDGAIDSLRSRATTENDVAFWVAALVLQAPRAVAAQRQMDKHQHGYRNKQARLFELIDFNDTYVTTVLALPEQHLAVFDSRVRAMMNDICARLRLPGFSDEQWQAITMGLSREIAVYRGARLLGYRARMTSRVEDAMGVDMVVTNSDDESINLDIKTRSSFHFRLMDLEREGRISHLELEQGEKFGHLTVINGHGHESVRTTLLRIDEETYGRTTNYSLERLEPLRDSLEQIVASVRNHQ